MKIAAEISMYPLTPDYEAPILDFIKRLNHYPDLKVITNAMSTQLFGPYEVLLQVLQKEIKTTFEGENKVIMVMKLINAELI